MRWFAVLISVLVLAASVSADEPREPTWSEAEGVVRAGLRERDIGAWAREEAKTPAGKDARALLMRLALFIRAGHHDALQALLPAMAELPASVQRRALSDAAKSLIHREEWGLVRSLLDHAPQARPGDAVRFLDAWAEKQGPAEVATWLEARVKVDPDGWLAYLVPFRKRMGTADALLEELEREVRTHPEDLSIAYRFVRVQGCVDRAADVTWMADVCRPRLAVNCLSLADMLMGLSPSTAIIFLERSLAMPFTDADATALETTATSGRRPPRADVEQNFRNRTKRGLMGAYRRVGDVDKAQTILAELTAKYPGGVPPSHLAREAGETQKASGARDVEDNIKKAEATRTDSAAYWMVRAQYYIGREEKTEVEKAFKKALAITPHPESPAERRPGDLKRYQVIRGYARWLENSGTVSVAKDLYWRDFTASDSQSGYGRWLASRLLELQRAHGVLSSVEEERLRAFPPAKRRTHAVGRQQAAFRRFEAHLARDEWKAAEALWPDARQRLNYKEAPEWLGRIAIAAARSGARGDALRLWRARTNLDLGSTLGLDAMLAAGMRDELIAFYAELAKSDPASVHPRRIGALLTK